MAERQGVLVLLVLSPPCGGASYQVYQTFRPTNSDAQDMDVSGQDARLSFVDTLAPDQRPAPDELDAREERSMPPKENK